MDSIDLEVYRNQRIDDLNAILVEYRNSRTPKNSMRVIIFLLTVCGSILFLTISNLFGVLWGFIITLAVAIIARECYNNLGIEIKNSPMSDGHLACCAFIAMDALVKIKNGTYNPDFNMVIGCTGKHITFYKEFSQLYPELSCKELENLSKIEVTDKDEREIFRIIE